MAKRKRRNAITMVSLLLALAALIVVYLWYDNKPSEEDTVEVTPTIDLATIDTTQISSLHYRKDDADITFALQGELWISKEEPDRPINQDYMKAILNAINDIKADRIIMENPENLADYGLADPAAYLQTTMTDGTTVTVRLGNIVGDSDGYYGLVNEDGIVYLMPIELGTALQYNNTQMTAVEESPEITAANINYIRIDNRDGEDFELTYLDDEKLDNAGSNMYSWQILKPYGEGFTADNAKVSELQANYTSFNYISCVDYKGEDLSPYGLEEPMATIDIGYYVTRTETLEAPETNPETGEEITEKTYYDEYEYKVYIGNQDDKGNYYIRKEGSNYVYTIGAAAIDKMLQVEAFQYLNPFVCIPNIDIVDKIIFDYGDTTDTMSIERKIETNAEGVEETIATYIFNGNEVKEDAFKALYQTIISAKYDTEVKNKDNAVGSKAIATIEFHILGADETTISVSFLPYDDSFYLVKKSDDVSFLVDKRKIDDMAKEVSQFTGKSEE